MIKIAIVVGDISRSAGTERAVVNLSNLLLRYGEYKVSIISLYSDLDARSAFELSNKAYIINCAFSKANFIKKVYYYFLTISKLKQIITTQNIDIVLGTTHAINCLLPLTNSKIPKIACEHMSYSACPPLSRILRSFIYKFVDGLVLLTQEESDKYSFVHKNRRFVIPNSLSFMVTEPSNLDSKRIITVGRLSKIKGLDYLITITQKLVTALPDWKLDVFGDGEERDRLQQQIDDFGLSSYITLHHSVKKIEKELINSSIFILTSRSEGFPMVLLEAQACGLPIVTYNCSSSIPLIVSNNESGFIDNVGEIDKVADKIIMLANDVKLRRKLGFNAFTNSMTYSDSKIYILWNNLLNKYIKNDTAVQDK